jgi:hypothetical protein
MDWVGIVRRTLNFGLVLLAIAVDRVSNHHQDGDKDDDDCQLDDRDEQSDRDDQLLEKRDDQKDEPDDCAAT